MRDEPNDWHSQDCLTFLKDQDIFGYFVWHWNDWDCDSEDGYIFEKEAVLIKCDIFLTCSNIQLLTVVICFKSLIEFKDL